MFKLVVVVVVVVVVGGGLLSLLEKSLRAGAPPAPQWRRHGFLSGGPGHDLKNYPHKFYFSAVFGHFIL